MKNQTYNLIIIGGGPAGMMAAGRAGELGSRVLLIEKNERLGKKLSLTGGRRCNITNAEFNDRIFLENFPESKKFLFSPFSQFNAESTFDFFESRGLPLIVEDRKRAFPKSEKAEDVCKVLKKYIEESGNVSVKLDTAFKSFVVEAGKLVGVKTSEGIFRADKIVLASGGMAAPETGSTGDGLKALKAIGHTIKAPDPNLAPLRTSTKWVQALSGVSVDDMTLRFLQKEKVGHKARGRLLFTHFGISGPLVINSAHQVKKLLKTGPVIASIDFFPDFDLGSLDAWLLEIFEKNKNKKLKSVFKDLLPNKLVETILTRPELVLGDLPIHSISKEQRKKLGNLLKDLRFPIVGTMGFEWSIVADGGVPPKEVDFKNMRSRLFPNLYLIGDVIDINRPSGGFSLQLCWTTGFVAGTDVCLKN